MHQLDENKLIEIWKHFAVTGGADKDRMVTITTWVLGFSAALLGYLAINLIDYSPFVAVYEPGKTRALSCLGAFVSVFGARIVMLYAGYTNWNWEKANSLASQMKTKFKIDELPPLGQIGKLLPIFWWFLFVAVSLSIVHVTVFVLSFFRVSVAAVTGTGG